MSSIAVARLHQSHQCLTHQPSLPTNSRYTYSPRVPSSAQPLLRMFAQSTCKPQLLCTHATCNSTPYHGPTTQLDLWKLFFLTHGDECAPAAAAYEEGGKSMWALRRIDPQTGQQRLDSSVCIAAEDYSLFSYNMNLRSWLEAQSGSISPADNIRS